MSSKKALVVPALKKQSATIIMAHGLGDSGAGWVSLAENWRRRSLFEDVKFIFPNAPMIPITVNMGYEMPGWYDIKRLGGSVSLAEMQREQDEAGILRSREVITKFITDELDAGIPSNRIILGGFSQGGAMALITGTTIPHTLAGIFGLSTYLVMANKIKELAQEAKDANKNTPFFMAHGDADQVLNIEFGRLTAERLRKELGHQVEWHEYSGMPHTADVEEIDDLETFVTRCLDKTSSAAL